MEKYWKSIGSFYVTYRTLIYFSIRQNFYIIYNDLSIYETISRLLDWSQYTALLSSYLLWDDVFKGGTRNNHEALLVKKLPSHLYFEILRNMITRSISFFVEMKFRNMTRLKISYVPLWSRPQMEWERAPIWYTVFKAMLRNPSSRLIHASRSPCRWKSKDSVEGEAAGDENAKTQKNHLDIKAVKLWVTNWSIN